MHRPTFAINLKHNEIINLFMNGNTTIHNTHFTVYAILSGLKL